MMKVCGMTLLMILTLMIKNRFLVISPIGFEFGVATKKGDKKLIWILMMSTTCPENLQLQNLVLLELPLEKKLIKNIGN